MKLPFLLNSVSRSVSLKEVETVFSKFLKVLPTLDGNTISHCINILSKKEINQPKFLWLKTAEILTDSDNKSNHNSILSRLEVKDVCIILNSFAKVNFLNLKLIETGTSIIIRQIRNIHTRDLCNVIHSLGKLNQHSTLSAVINKLFKPKNNKINNINSVLKVISNCNEKDFSMLLRVLMLNSENLDFDSVTKKLLNSLTDKYDSLSDQTLAILANSVAQYGKDENGTLSVLAPIITLRLRRGNFTPQCIAQISNGFAKLNFRDFELFSALAQRVLMNPQEFPPRCLANLLNGFSKLNIFNEQLFTKLIPQFESNLSLMTPQCIGNTVNAYSKFSSQLNLNLLFSFFNKMILELLNFNTFDSFIGQNYANILSGITKLYTEFLRSHNSQSNYTNETYELCNKMLMALIKKLYVPMLEKFEEFNHLDVLMIFNSMARFRICDNNLIGKLLSKLKLFMQNYKIFELINIVNGCSKFYTTDLKTYFPDSNLNTSLTQSTLNTTINHANKFNTRDLYNTLDLNNTVENNNTVDSTKSVDVAKFELKDVSTISGICNIICTSDVVDKVLILDYYKHFMDHLIKLLRGKSLSYNHIRLVFNSLTTFNMHNKDYNEVLSKVLVDSELDKNEERVIKTFSSVVDYYYGINQKMPNHLEKYILSHLNTCTINCISSNTPIY
ncbi:hypothetical protein TpMuguga_03g00811 [Theileria parva strain Muguga]|uniref:RNA-editing substrate-binding complex 6 protein domain-containing protein n=1 Tax=Theileria parva TaxID=5875 RepID=Q4MYN0_THEPA|nr:uncharacterized protein TpMuguga_03g00811 [Theileria parva strain Muguga]EAN30652.1 hypothetical protein TpMuguga_03g00811 [Theileria parva strain Muguga]|eukprot:XP_762935.1 hypothetical protein [Theileria parva strain Muguga]